MGWGFEVGARWKCCCFLVFIRTAHFKKRGHRHHLSRPPTYDLSLTSRALLKRFADTFAHMNTALLILTSLLAVVISVLSVQLPRYIEYRKSLEERDNAARRLMTDGTTTPPRPSTWKFARKPWDPPFPTSQKRAAKQRQSEYLILPAISPKHVEMPEDGTDEMEEKRKETMEEGIPPCEKVLSQNPKKEKETKRHWGVMAIMWTSLAILACILLVVSFALLIAHCLAWFIVYKTEARLGEARRGLAQGGEMRLCLCARG